MLKAMSVSIDSRATDGTSGAGLATTARSDGPAARAFALAWTAGLLLGLLGLASFVPVFARLLESWRLSAHAVAHHVSILGQTLSYPAANTGAVIVLALALLGGIVAAIALCAIGSEMRAARRLARRLARLDPAPRDGVFVIDDERPDAFCAGLLRPRVYLTTGALAGLDAPALDAVLVHEREHARRRDPLRLATSRVIARSLFFLPAIRELRRGQKMLAEVSADESAVSAAAGDRSALARAMLSFSEGPKAGASAGVDPARVDYLLGEAPRLAVSRPDVYRGPRAARARRGVGNTGGQGGGRLGHPRSSVPLRPAVRRDARPDPVRRRPDRNSGPTRSAPAGQG